MIAKASRFVVLARAGTKSFVPLWFRAVRYEDHVPLPQNWMDSPALFPMGQAKSVRRGAAPFTSHAQLFHKHGNCASEKKSERLSGDLC
jgi:hypothetical protein